MVSDHHSICRTYGILGEWCPLETQMDLTRCLSARTKTGALKENQAYRILPRAGLKLGAVSSSFVFKASTPGDLVKCSWKTV